MTIIIQYISIQYRQSMSETGQFTGRQYTTNSSNTIQQYCGELSERTQEDDDAGVNWKEA